jgi:hypothetical protein
MAYSGVDFFQSTGLPGATLGEQAVTIQFPALFSEKSISGNSIQKNILSILPVTG